MAIVRREQYKTNESKKTKTKGCKRANGKGSTSRKRILESKKNKKSSAGSKKDRKGKKTRKSRRNKRGNTGGKRTKRVGGTEEPVLAIEDQKGGGEIKEPALAVILSLFWSDCWQAFPLAAAYLSITSLFLIAYFLLENLFYDYLYYCLQLQLS